MLNEAIGIMSGRLRELLQPYGPAMCLYGSVVMDDFHFGLSDIDFVLLLERPLENELAESLLLLRQSLAQEWDENPFFRLFEGVMMSKESFFSGGEDIVVYWGTSGQRLTKRHEIDPFARLELIKSGRLLFGKDFRHLIPYPSRDEIVGAVKRHYETIMNYGDSGAGWFLDIARCLYTLETGDVITKTKAGEWAIARNLCPDIETLKRIVEIRMNPMELLDDPETRRWLRGLGPQIREFAQVLKSALRQSEQSR
jgi:predicted nucleotidyltransferase